MLVETKARVGVFAIALGAYLPQFPQLVPEFEGQYADFKMTLPDTVELIDGGIVTTKEKAMEAGDKFRAADVDLVILQLLTYATSYNMLPAVRDLDVPVVLVNVQKKKAPDYANTDTPTWLGELYACGAVGEMVAALERAGKRHAVITGVVEGGDPEVEREIADWCRAAQVRRRFRDANIAQIGRPYPGMMDLYIDETNLYHRMWLYANQTLFHIVPEISLIDEENTVVSDVIPEHKEYVSIREAAECLGISEKRVYRLIQDGTLNGKKIGKAWFIRYADIASYEKED